MDMGRGEERLRCMGRVTWKRNTICKIDSQWELAVWLRELRQRLCITYRGAMRGRLKMEGIYVYLWQIHVEIRQKTAKFYKAINLQLKN